MKMKLIFFCVLAALMFHSCKSDDPEVQAAIDKFCKPTRLYDNDGWEYKFKYDGDLLIQIDEGEGIKRDYEYENQQLVRIIWSSSSSRDTMHVTYNNDGKLLAHESYYDGELDSRKVFYWNADSTLKSIEVEIYDNGQVELIGEAMYFEYKDGDIAKITWIDETNLDGKLDTLNDEYEVVYLTSSNKPNPFYGFYAFDWHHSDLEFVDWYAKNMVTTERWTENGAEEYKSTNTHTFKSNGQPESTTYDFDDGEKWTILYDYLCE